MCASAHTPPASAVQLNARACSGPQANAAQSRLARALSAYQPQQQGDLRPLRTSAQRSLPAYSPAHPLATDMLVKQPDNSTQVLHAKFLRPLIRHSQRKPILPCTVTSVRTRGPPWVRTSAQTARPILATNAVPEIRRRYFRDTYACLTNSHLSAQPSVTPIHHRKRANRPQHVTKCFVDDMRCCSGVAERLRGTAFGAVHALNRRRSSAALFAHKHPRATLERAQTCAMYIHWSSPCSNARFDGCGVVSVELCSCFCTYLELAHAQTPERDPRTSQSVHLHIMISLP